VKFKEREEDLIQALGDKFGRAVPSVREIIAAKREQGKPVADLYKLAQQHAYHVLMSGPPALMNGQTVISVRRHINKRAFLAQRFSNLVVKDAVDGRAISPEDDIFEGKYNALSPGQIGVALSHIQAWKAHAKRTTKGSTGTGPSDRPWLWVSANVLSADVLCGIAV
jgi:hypothetical protein